MFVGGILNTTLVSAIPDVSTYTHVHHLGECFLDNSKMYDSELDQSEINTEVGITRVWNSDTIFLADFEGTLETGNLQNGGLVISGIRILRKASDEALNKLLIDLPFDNNVRQFIDYLPRNRVNYTYYISALSGSISGQSLGGEGMADFYGWILTDSDYAVGSTPTTTFNFDLEIETDSIKTNKGYTIYQNYTKFPAFRFDDRNYASSKISTIPYSLNGNQITIDTNLLDELEAFINDGKEKILRSPSGKSWKVVTTDFDYKYFDKVIEQPFSVNFSWTQTGEA